LRTRGVESSVTILARVLRRNRRADFGRP
jgi:hypothetical protein